MSAQTTKGYFLAIGCGLVVIATSLLIMLQWGVKANFSFYGKHIPDIPTIYVILAAGVASPIFVLCCRGFAKGVWILYKARRAEAKAAKQMQVAASKVASTAPEAKDTLDVNQESEPQSPDAT